MKMKPVQALLLMAVISTTTSWTTPGPQGLNLNGKMFTLSSNRGGISFYPPSWPSTPSSTTSPYYTNTPHYTSEHPNTTTQHYPTTKHPYTSTKRPYTRHPYTSTKRPYTRHPYTSTRRPYTRHPYTTTKRPYTRHPYTTTTAPSARGVSVCLRYLSDFEETRIFTVSPSSTPLQMTINRFSGYTLNFNPYGYNKLYLKPNIRFWSNIGPDIWSRVCFTVDSMKNVAQVFSGSNISIRKMLPDQYVWSGEPVIEFPGFDGQVTDIQMWDYPLSSREVFKYMTSGVRGSYRGSVLTWSSISYTPSGNILLEDVYEWQAKQKIIGRRGRRPKGGRKNRKFVDEEEREEGIRDQL